MNIIVFLGRCLIISKVIHAKSEDFLTGILFILHSTFQEKRLEKKGRFVKES